MAYKQVKDFPSTYACYRTHKMDTHTIMLYGM